MTFSEEYKCNPRTAMFTDQTLRVSKGGGMNPEAVRWRIDYLLAMLSDGYVQGNCRVRAVSTIRNLEAQLEAG